MSYEIINSIKIKDNRVYIKSGSNNVCPHYFEEGECKLLSNILQEKGKGCLDIEILKEYDSGCFQRGNNKYTRALEVLRHFPEYHKFDWRGNYEESVKNKDSEDYFKLLERALTTLLPKQKFIICKDYRGEVIYGKKTRNYMKWERSKDKATKYNYKEDAEFAKKCFTHSKAWEVLPV